MLTSLHANETAPSHDTATVQQPSNQVTPQQHGIAPRLGHVDSQVVSASRNESVFRRRRLQHGCAFCVDVARCRAVLRDGTVASAKRHCELMRLRKNMMR